MEGLHRIALIVLIIALALYVFVILSFAVYAVLLFAMWLIGLVWSAH